VEELQMDWLRSEDLNEEKNVTAPIAIIAVQHTPSSPNGTRAYHLGMSRLSPCPDSDSLDRWEVADVLLRQEPDEEEDEEEDEGNGKEYEDDDDDTDDGYSE
jgi:hypothetical protein